MLIPLLPPLGVRLDASTDPLYKPIPFRRSPIEKKMAKEAQHRPPVSVLGIVENGGRVANVIRSRMGWCWGANFVSKASIPLLH